MGERFDKIIIGAGLYGMYAAQKSMEKGQKVLILEQDAAPFMRATYINQARVHMGYHYPRSLTTAMKSAGYFRRFVEDYGFCIHDKFQQIYATSDKFSWTNRQQFVDFCKAADIYCREVPPSVYFREGMCDGAFLTEEYTYDARILLEYFLEAVQSGTGATLKCNAKIEAIKKTDKSFEVYLKDGECVEAPFLLNATYASVNQILSKTEGIKKEYFPIKYELCEIILCKPSAALKDIGITVMDGPFFSIMPFGKTPYHSLTSVTFTPHVTSYDVKPTFACQKGTDCSPEQLRNCDLCEHRPSSAWSYMSHLADKYLREEYAYQYEKSLFSMKPILRSSEVDDSRPTAIRISNTEPAFISVLSGKINTVYDLDEYI